MLPLDKSACSLLRDDSLVDRYNAVLKKLEEAAHELPRFGQREVVSEARDELAKLAVTMTKKRFKVGFIGPSQIGKSKTVINLLGVANKDGPTPPGSGGATTAVPSRTSHRPPADGVENTISLHYFSKPEFLQRVKDICAIVGIRFDENLQEVRKAALAKQEEDPHSKAADMNVLLNLIEAATKFPDALCETGLVEKGTWADRADYMCHPHPPRPTRYTLLREVSIEFMTTMVSPEVEMIDLPGIDVDKKSDASLTLRFVSDLDGAFMVQSGLQVTAGAIADLADEMRKVHGRTLGERIWMIVTRCDQLNELQVYGEQQPKTRPSMFCHLAESMRLKGIKLDNIHFIGNEYYEVRRQEGLADSQPSPDPIIKRYPLVLQSGPEGQPVVPELCLRNEGQVEAWKQFVLNGGIPALRDTMQTKVADAVRKQTQVTVRKKLNEIIDRLVAGLQAAEQQAGMTVEEMMRAVRWSGELENLSEQVGCEPVYSQQPASEIEQMLTGLIVKWGDFGRGDLARSHEQLSGMLFQAGLHEATRLTTVVTSSVRSRIEERTQAEPPPVAADLPTPLDHWMLAVTKYLELGTTFEGRDFRTPIFRGFRDDPSPLTNGGHNMQAGEYPELMRLKAARVARVYGTRLVHEIQCHLHRLQGRYRALGTEIEHIDANQRQLYAKYRQDFERLRV